MGLMLSKQTQTLRLRVDAPDGHSKEMLSKPIGVISVKIIHMAPNFHLPGKTGIRSWRQTVGVLLQ